jgi:hypothetical protein
VTAPVASATRRVTAILIGLAVAMVTIWSGLALGGVGILVLLLTAFASGVLHFGSRVLDLRRVGFVAFWFFIYLSSVLLPGLAVASGHEGEAVNRYVFSIVSVLVTVPMGVVLANLLAGFHGSEITAFFDRAVEKPGTSFHDSAVFWVLLGFAVALTFLYLTEVQVIPLVFLVRNPGSAAELVFLREDSFKLLDSPFVYWYDVLRRAVYPFLVACALGRWMATGEKRWRWAFFTSAGAGFFFNSLSLAKAPVAIIILVSVLFFYVYKGGKISLRGAVTGVVSVMAFPVIVLVALARGNGVGFWALVQALFERMFVTPAEILANYFIIFPDTVEFLGGRSIGRLAWLQGTPVFDVANYAFQFMFPNGALSGSAPAAFIGYFYADWGIPGVLVGGLATGVILQMLQIYLVRQPKTIEVVAAFGFMYWGVWQINLAALPMSMLSGGPLFVLALLWMSRAGGRFLRVAARPSPFDPSVP